jgi:hypothetical protein
MAVPPMGDWFLQYEVDRPFVVAIRMPKTGAVERFFEPGSRSLALVMS